MKHLLVGVCGVLVLAGCSANGGMDPYTMGHRLNGPVLGSDATWNTRFADGTLTAEARPALSREFAYHLISRSDRKCEDYLVGLNAADNGFNGLLDLVPIALSFLGAGASSLGSANDLATGAGVVGTLRSTASNVFAGNEFGIIYRTVHIGRDAERRTLATRIEDGDFDTWGPEAIASTVNAYDVKCGINYANRLLARAVEQVARDSEADTTQETDPADETDDSDGQ